MSSRQTYIRTGRPELDELYPLVKGFMEKDVLDVVIDGAPIRGYRTPDARSIWIRDYSDMMRGFKYFESDLRSVVDHFAATQATNGRIFDYFTTFPEKLPCERENWTKYVRVPVEADVEYRFVKAAYLAWQATGDDEWIESLLPAMSRALEFAMSHPWYWDAEAGLVKRAYTIDTWDFAYTAGKHSWLQFQINDDTFWGFMHGDNSGYFEACRLMAQLCRRFDRSEEAKGWAARAESLKRNTNRLCFNGRFYTHFVKKSAVRIAGVDEAQQLSLSNPMDMNRGIAGHDRAVSIIREYQQRRRETGAFAEWFSIDPPFPDGIFGDEKLVGGAYVNGGIMPLVGGELARAALEHGFEEYGVDILRRYYEMISERGETYLWYFPDGRPASVETSTSPEAEPTDGWGSSAMLFALIEGLAGIEDEGKGFDMVRIAPRWPAAGVQEAEVQVCYACSGRALSYRFECGKAKMKLSVSAEGSAARLHVLLPEGRSAKTVDANGVAIRFANSTVQASPYVDFEADIGSRTDFVIAMA